MIARDSFSLNASQNEQLDDVTGDDGIPALSSTPHHPRSSSPETVPHQRKQFCFAPSIRMLSFAAVGVVCVYGATVPSLEAKVRLMDLALSLKCVVHTQSSEVRFQMSVPGMLWVPPVQDLTSSFLRKVENHC